MSNYLKMADVFPSELSIDDLCDDVIVDCDGVVLESFCGSDCAKYTCHAINSHDELVQQRDELLAISKRLVQWDTDYPVNCDNGYQGLKVLNEIIADAVTAIAKAKGGAA